MDDNEKYVRAKFPDAFMEAYDCDCGKLHYRILRKRSQVNLIESGILSLYFDTEQEAWAAAALKSGMREE